MDEELTLEEKLLRKKQAISTSPSPNIAAYVVVYKALGIDKEFAVLCMEELAKRRASGDDFNFEDFIEKEVAKIPKIDGSMDVLKMSKDIMGNVGSLKGVIQTVESIKNKVQK